MIQLPRYKVFCTNQPLLKALEPPIQEVDLQLVIEVYILLSSMTTNAHWFANDAAFAPALGDCRGDWRMPITLFGSRSDACFSDCTVSKIVITLLVVLRHSRCMSR